MSNAGSLRELLGQEAINSPLKGKRKKALNTNKRYKKRRSVLVKKLSEVQDVVKYGMCSCLCKRKRKDYRNSTSRTKRKDYKVNKNLRRAVTINLSAIENDAYNERM